MPRSLGENVNDKAAEIEQHPFRAGRAFAVSQLHADSRELLVDFVADCIHLSSAESGAKQKGVGKRSEPLEIKQSDLRRLLFLRRGDGHAKFGLQRILFLSHRKGPVS